MADVKVDTKQIENLGKELRAGMIVALGRLGERGYQLLRKEVPVVTTNLQQGVAPPDIDEEKLTATLTVSARSARTSGGAATVHYVSGKTKAITLRPTVPYNYADVVARGNKDAVVKPTKTKAFLIPITSIPDDESYISAGGKFFIVRMSRKGKAANPYDKRAAEQLEKEATNIVGAVFGELFN